MRTLSLLCAMCLFVTGADPAQDKPKDSKARKDQRPFQGNTDSSPIIISDGSVKIRHGKPHNHFAVHGSSKVNAVQTVNYRPTAIGYQCDPSMYPYNGMGTACKPSTPCPTTATTGCTIDVSAATSWDLSLCETAGQCAPPGVVHMSWTNGQLFTMNINSPDNLAYKSNSGNKGAYVKHSGNVLMNATLSVAGGGTFYFACSPSADCVTIADDCTQPTGVNCR